MTEMRRVASRSVTAGAAWMVAARFAERLLGLASTVILARLLAPEDFGLVAMAMVFVAAAELLGAFGLDWALIRQPHLEGRHLDTAWTLRAILGCGSLFLLTASAIPVADFYREPRISPMLVVLGICLLIGALENPGVVIFRRDMNFAKEFQLRTVAKVVGAVVAVSAAIYLRSYWALLLGILASRLATTVLSYVIHPHRPRPTLAAQREILGFSAWLWLGNILTFLRVKAVELLLGRLVGTHDLGLFSVSNELAQLASTEIAAPINRALFSAYAREGDQAHLVGKAYLETAPVIWGVTLPIALITYIAAPQLVLLVLGRQWLEAEPLLRILSVAGAATLFSAGAIQVYWAINHARLESAMEGFWVGSLLAFVIILTPTYGVTGAALAVMLSGILLMPINLLLLRKYAGVSLRETLHRTWRITLACGFMHQVVTIASTDWIPDSGSEALAHLVGIALIAVPTYILALCALWCATGRPDGPERRILDLIATQPVFRSRGSRTTPK